jgi:hypothetical protein
MNAAGQSCMAAAPCSTYQSAPIGGRYNVASGGVDVSKAALFVRNAGH